MEYLRVRIHNVKNIEGADFEVPFEKNVLL